MEAKDYEGVVPPSEDILTRIGELGQELYDITQREEELEEMLKSLGEKKKKIQREYLPELLTNANMEKFSLLNGSEIEMKNKCLGSLPKDPIQRADALGYLREQGHEDIIKHEIVVQVPRGKDEVAYDAMKELERLGLDFNDDETVHHSTLQAFVKERLEAGDEIDAKLLGIYPVTEAKIKGGKK